MFVDSIRYRTDRWFASQAACCVLLAASVASAQQPVQWKTGVVFRQQLDAPGAGITWEDRSLREGLMRLSQTHGVAIFLDRRIDPGRLITLTLRDQTLEAIIRTIATAAIADVAIYGPVVYVGPRQTTRQLATLAALRRQEVAKMPSEARTRLLKAQAWQWEELAQPRQLALELAQQANVTVKNAEAIPHDLWPAVSLPPLPWLDRLTLLVVGFGLTFEIDDRGTTVRLIPQPNSVAIEKRYRPSGGAAELAPQLRRLLPDAQVRVEKEQLVIAAAEEDHDKIQRLLAGQTVRGGKSTKAAAEKLYSLQSNEPAGKVLRKVAESLGKELKYDSRVLDRLRQPVQLNLKDASLDYLLDMTLKPLGLSWRVTDDALEISEQSRSASP
jgi:hypothetical protein